MQITSTKQARSLIGTRVWWTEKLRGPYVKDRSGILQDVSGKNVLIDGDYKWRTNLLDFRTTEKPTA